MCVRVCLSLCMRLGMANSCTVDNPAEKNEGISWQNVPIS